MIELHVLRVFIGPDGTGGNPLGVVLRGADVPIGARQAVAADLGFSETVFVDDARRGLIRIFSPAVELPFAGHPLVGTAWLVAREHGALDTLRPPSGEVPMRVAGERAFIAGRPAWAPPFRWVELASPAAVDALDGAPDGHDLIGAYAWKGDGVVRARVFALSLGILEDEATGAAAVRLAALLGSEIEIHQGKGSVIAASLRTDGMVEIGGRVALDEVRQYELPGDA